MPTVHYARRFRYHAWAGSALAAALPAADAPAAVRPLAHALVADRLWLLRIRAEPTEGVLLWPDLDAQGCRALARRNAAAYAALLDWLEPDALATPVAYATTAGAPHESALGDILDHVLLHGAYHRGQTARALREAGIPPPSTDFIAWVRRGEPEAGS
jgi:uncharacterized damage-inducible protein DinB